MKTREAQASRAMAKGSLFVSAAVRTCLLGLLTSLAAHAGVSSKPVLSLADLGAISTLSGLAVSTDGKLAAIIVSRPDYSLNRRQKLLVLVETGSGAQRVVSTGDLDAPAFSPRGNALAWLAPDADGIQQVVDLPVASRTDTPRTITHAAGTGVQQFGWSPDGTAIAYLAPEAALPPAGNARFDRTFEVADSDYLGTSYLARNAGPAPTRLWVTALSDGSARLLQTDDGTIKALTWMPDGRHIAISHQPGASDVAARFGDVSLVPVDGDGEIPLVPPPARVAPAGRVRVSARGLIAYPQFHGEDPWTFGNQVAVLENGAPRDITVALDRDVGDFQWLPDGTGLLVEAPDHLRMRLWTVSLSGAARPIDLGQISVADIGMSPAGLLVFVGSEPTLAPELYVMSSLRSKPVRLTHFNTFLEERDLGPVRPIGWRSEGFEHAGVLTYPPGFTPGRKYPLLVNIHGGPEYSAQLAFNFESQFYAANGWLVFEPNYRGSNDQGSRYETAVIGDATAGPGRDIRAGLADVQALAGVDGAHVAVTGYSYGGVMTAWLIGHHQDWCAAIPGGVVVDFVQYYDQSETGIWIKTLLGSPHTRENREKYIEQSPATYLDQAKTPTLILQNVGDPNATVGQAYHLYHALKDNGVAARFIASDLDGHSSPDPFHERQVYPLTLDWMNQHCAGL